jgi:uncharacterized OB-fold protein
MSYTIVRVPPLGFDDQAPYPVVLVKIGSQVHVGQLVDHEGPIKIGQKVVAVLRRVRKPDAEGVIPYGIKFKPVS